MKSPFHTETLSRALYRVRTACRHVAERLRAWRHRKDGRDDRARTLDWAEERNAHGGAALVPARGMIGYAALFVGSLIFTQMLRSRASHIFFWFVLLLAPAMLLYTLTAKLALKVYLQTDRTDVEKMQPCPYELRIINSSIFAYPFIDAHLRIPRADAVRTAERRVRLSLPPMGVYSVANEISFCHRGTYEIGVSCFYVYDFFRIWRLRVDMDEYNSIFVLPRRRLLGGESVEARSDMAATAMRSALVYDRAEVLDVREYRMGDAMRDVHWKLSSKAEELLVRDFSGGSSDRTIVYCDLSARYPAKPPVPEGVDGRPLSRRAARRARKREMERVLAEQDRQRRAREMQARDELEGWMADGERDRDLATQATASPDVRAIADEDVMKKTDRRVAAHKGTPAAKETATGDTAAARADVMPLDVAVLSDDAYYADMNEYCADGVVELAISTVLRELRAGNACMLMWFDARAALGAFGFELAREADFDAIYRLFATAPLTSPDNGVGKLRSMLGDTQGIKQIFVTSAPDEAAIADLLALPGMTGGAEFGSTELLYYDPEERFAHAEERRAYLEGCRAMLAENGILMVNGSARLSGGEVHA